MNANISHKLVTADDGRHFIVSGNPTDGYDLYAARPEHVGHFKRSWQAVAAADLSPRPQP